MYDYIILRTQISLTVENRRLLDAEAARTGRSISSLIRDAVSSAYSSGRDTESDLRAIDAAVGAWSKRDADGEAYVERIRSGNRDIDSADLAIAATAVALDARLLTRNVEHFPMFEGLSAPY